MTAFPTRPRARCRRALLVAGLAVLATSSLALATSPTTNIHLGKTTFGPYVAQRLQDGHGYPIYLSTHDQRNKSRCSGSCALQFTPLTTHGRVKAWNGVKQKLLGTIDRGHGVKQVTYDHHPLYTATTDTPGSAVDDGCKLYNGRWYVVDKTGKPDKRWNWKCQGGY